jgi:hypothetical protein
MFKGSLTVPVALMLSGYCCFGQERIKVDIDDTVKNTIPPTISGSVMSADPQYSRSIWRVDLVPSRNGPTGSLVLEIHVVNVSAATRNLPISRDGVKLVAECPGHTVLQGSVVIGNKIDVAHGLKLGNFYGCEAFPATLVNLRPGEWVSYITKLPADHLPKEIRAQVDFSHTRYRQGANGQTAEDLEYSTYAFSTWATMP